MTDRNIFIEHYLVHDSLISVKQVIIPDIPYVQCFM